MGRITVENNVFIYREADLKKVLLDVNDFMANKSRIPMHSFDGDLTIPALLLNTMKEHEHLCREKNDSLEYLLMDVILISRLIQSPLPVKVLELGCVNGVLSYHLATILGKFNKESLLCCVCDVIGNNSNNQWLDRISLVDAAPELSLVAADYDKIQLAKNNFDIVIINGTVDFHEPYRLIKEAESFLKGNGMLICYSDNQPLLESSFRLIFSEREDYVLNPQNCIMVVKCRKNINVGDGKEGGNWHEEVREYLEEVRGIVNGEVTEGNIRETVNKLTGYIDDAIEKKDLDMKVELIRQRKVLLDFVVSCGQGRHGEDGGGE